MTIAMCRDVLKYIRFERISASAERDLTAWRIWKTLHVCISLCLCHSDSVTLAVHKYIQLHAHTHTVFFTWTQSANSSCNLLLTTTKLVLKATMWAVKRRKCSICVVSLMLQWQRDLTTDKLMYEADELYIM